VTEHRDPIEAWLSTDVDLLPSQPGAFERIRHRAHRRRTIRTVSAAAGAAVVVAAAVVIPSVSGMLPSGGPNRVNVGSTTPATASPTKHLSRSAKPQHPGIRNTGRAGFSSGLSLSGAQNGPKPPAGFSPTSVTFADGTQGAVLGTTSAGCPAGLCTAVAATQDYGHSWTLMGGPDAGPPNGSAGVSQIRFLYIHDGWAYGPALYATHNGGRSWHRVSLPGRVIDLATIQGRAFAVVAKCTGSGPNYTSGCTSFQLYSAAKSTNDWQPVAGASGQVAEAPGGLQLTNRAGYLLAGGLLFTGPVTGGAWHQVSVAAAGAPSCVRGGGSGAEPASGGLIAPYSSAGVQTLYLACQRPGGGASSPGAVTLYASGNSGSTWQQEATGPVRGTATSLADMTGNSLVLATSKGIFYSANAAAFRPARIAGGSPAGGFAFIGMTTYTEGIAVPADSSLGEVFITGDGGLVWRATPIG
jgi:hypothetical protein